MNQLWGDVLNGEFKKDYFKDLKATLRKESVTVYPKTMDIFKAFRMTPYKTVKVVILGQDPYHGEGQAEGLSFSVPPGVKQPPSLKNIFKEINEDLGIPVPKTGCLIPWAQQGVLLLNAFLTVKAGKAGSHKDIGWELFTNKVIKVLSEQRENLVFMFWGAFAKDKSYFVDSTKHLVLTSAHPSPFSASKGFFGNKHFSQTNEYLKNNGKIEIDWRLENNV